MVATVDLKDIRTALAGYSLDYAGDFPDNLDIIKDKYIIKFPQSFTDNFSYKLIKGSRGGADYEIRYIGHIGEGVTGS